MLAFWTKLGNSASLRKHFIESASSKYTVNRAYTGILVYYTEYTGIISKIYRCVTALLICPSQPETVLVHFVSGERSSKILNNVVFDVMFK
jgi:hypothetical protein